MEEWKPKVGSFYPHNQVHSLISISKDSAQIFILMQTSLKTFLSFETMRMCQLIIDSLNMLTFRINWPIAAKINMSGWVTWRHKVPKLMMALRNTIQRVIIALRAED